jgi:DNA polymerase-3 subunit gamma/tau
MLGLADRGRILDLFEKTMRGEIAAALSDLNDVYNGGADPLVVIQDLLEIAHFLTRLKVAPAAQGYFDGGSGEAKRATAMAAELPVSALTRAWQMLLRGLIEVRDAARPISAAEMALVRLAYAADLPPTDKLVRDVLEQGAAPHRSSSGAVAHEKNPTRSSSEAVAHERNPPRSSSEAIARESLPRSSSEAVAREKNAGGTPAVPGNAQALPRAEVVSMPAETMVISSLADLASLAGAKGSPVLKVQIENNIHLVRLEQGQIEFRPAPSAPRSLAGDLAQKLREWTGIRWVVTLAREGGAPTLAEQRKTAHAQKIEHVAQAPMVRAVLDRFPGAEIVAVRDRPDPEISPAEDDA